MTNTLKIMKTEQQQTAVFPIFRVDIQTASTHHDPKGRAMVEAAHQSGYSQLIGCRSARFCFLEGDISQAQAEQIARDLLADPVTEEYTVVLENGRFSPTETAHTFIETTFLPGVTDPPAENLVRVAREIGITGLARAATGERFTLSGTIDAETTQKLATELFANPVVQRFSIDQPINHPFLPYEGTDDTVEIIALRLVSNEGLMAISTERRLALDLAEMQAIQDYFQQEDRDPTDVELEMLAQTWSEHCVHKTFRAQINYTGPLPAETAVSAPTVQKIDGLLNTYIRSATEEVDKSWVRSAFVDNAGIVAFDDTFDLAFKVETHNHPSALEPFGGANTGVGGVVRDVLGVSARPIANTDILCFGPPDLPAEELPQGSLHPRRIAAGVIAGVEDYGNKMGIPTVNGAVLYHDGYTANPLVYVGCLGILPHGSHPTDAKAGDLIIAIGGRTGRDGLRGATFSSMEMDVETGDIAGASVQIGHPIQEKKVQEAVLSARDEKLYTAITDCGAGGFSSAIGEMTEHVGARVQLQNITLKYPGLTPWEVWLSEAQERVVMAVPQEQWPRLQTICEGLNVEAIHLGEFEASKRLQLFNGDHLVADLTMDFLHDGLPLRQMDAIWEMPELLEAPLPEAMDPTAALLALLAHPDVRSKEDVVRQYDHEVQGGTAVKPFTGVDNQGPGDAAVIVPLDTLLDNDEAGAMDPKGAALSNGICPGYGELDPYAMAWAAVDEAMRNLVAVGADPDQVSLLDNFCWGNPNLPDRLGSLVRCAQGCYDAAVAFNAPFVSGKDSLNNEYTGGDGRKHAIPGTLLISALGIVPSVAKTTTMALKKAGNYLYTIGETRAELGGGHYLQVAKRPFNSSPPPQHNPNALTVFRALHQAIAQNLVQACHDCAEGGLAVALAEMSLAGNVGLDVSLAHTAVDDADMGYSQRLFSESLSRFVVEVAPEQRDDFEQLLTTAEADYACIGQTTATHDFIVRDLNENAQIHLQIQQLDAAWRGHFAVEEKRPLIANHPPSPQQKIQMPALKSTPRVLILHADGTNRDRDAMLACQLAGGEPEIVHMNQLLNKQRRWDAYHMLVIPGGFSYGDDLGAGALWAMDLRHHFGTELERFVESGRPVLGICNGFQVLVKSGLLPGDGVLAKNGRRAITLTTNDSDRFECRWVTLSPNTHSPSLFTQELDQPIYCPAAHGEGRIVIRDEATMQAMQAKNLIALQYVAPDGSAAMYPDNPNGSALNIAGLCNPAGNILGLMPHPEDHIFPWQHPQHHHGAQGMMGLNLFINGIKNA